jgi:alpha-amylase
MKKNLRKLATMGAIALSLSTGIVPAMGAVITAHAETDAERHRKWARDYEDANWNGVYITHNIAAKVTATEWEDDIRDIEKGRTMSFTEYGTSVEYTRGDDGKIQIIKISDGTLDNANQLNMTHEELINDCIGEVEKYDNQFSHTYIPVTKKMVLGKGFLLTAHYDMIQTNNDPIQKYREYDQTGGIDEELSKSLESNTSSSSNNHSSSNGGSGSSGGSSSSNKAKSTNSSSLTGWVSTSDGWMYQINGNDTKGWQNINGTWYYLNGSGIMQTGWVLSNGKWYYMNTNGSMATGWVNTNGKWYFLNGAGDMATGWVLSNGKWYYLDSDGHMLSNTTVGNYRLDASGAWIQ